MAGESSQRGKRKRRLFRCALLLILLALLAGVIVSRSGVLRIVVVNRLEAMLDCDVECRSAVIGLDGRLVAFDVRLSIPDLEGQAGRFFQARRLEASIDPSTLLHGGQIRDVRVVRPLFRVSQGTDFSINLAEVEWTGSGAGGQPGALPSIEFVNGVIELGEHELTGTGAGYHRLLELPVSGKLSPRAGDPGWLDVNLTASPGQSTSGRALDPGVEMSDVALTGWLDLEAGAGLLELDELQLAFFGVHPAPRAIMDIWRRMDLRGRLERASLTYADDRGVRARFQLDGVELNVPLAPEGRMGEDWVSMSGVTGSLEFGADGLRAELHGSVEDLACDVTLRTMSLDLDAGFTCRIEATELPIASQPAFLAHTPEHVRNLFRRLSGPTAVVSGQVDIERLPRDGDREAEIAVGGELSFRNGAITYAGFPYPVTDLRGRMRFDAVRLELIRMEGVGPTGAELAMTGHFEPLGPSSGFNLHVTGGDVPIDQHLLDALPSSSRRAVEGLLDQEAYDTLKARGSLPAGFALGGNVDIWTDVYREPGAEAEETTFTVGILADSIGTLPAVLPLPMQLRDASLTVREGVVQLKSGSFRPLTGGRIELGGAYNLPSEGSADSVVLTLEGEGIPVREALMEAIHLIESRRQDDGMPDVSGLIRGFGIGGRMNFRAEALPDGFSCEIPLRSLEVEEGVSAPLTDLSGVLELRSDGLSLHSLEAMCHGAHLQLDLGLSLEGDRAWEVRGHLLGLDLAERVEDVLGMIGGQFAGYEETVSEVRDRLRPEGVADLGFMVSGSESEAGEILLTVKNLRGGAFDTELGRLSAEDLEGTLRYGGGSVLLDKVTGNVGLDGETAGRALVQGELALDETSATRLDIELTDFRFESGLVRQILEERSAQLADFVERADPEGVFDGTIRWVSGSERDAERMAPVIRPQSLSFDRFGTRVVLRDMSGVIRNEGSTVVFENVHGESDAWSLTVDGRLGVDAGEINNADLRLSAVGTRLDDSIRVLLPAGVQEVLRSLKLDVDGRFDMVDAEFRVRPDDPENDVSFDATVSFDGGKAEAQLPLEDVVGVITVRRGAGGAPDGSTEVFLTADSLVVGGDKGIPLTDGKLRLRSTEWGWVSPLLQARLEDGMLVGEGILRDGVNGVGPTYEWSATLTGIPLAGLIRNQGDESGRIDGVIDVSGVLGDAGTVRGRGSLQLRDGDLLAGTGLKPLLELSSLTVPTGERIDTGDVEFHVSGPKAVVDLLEFSAGEGGSIVVRGIGNMSWRNLELDLRISSRQRQRVPGLSDVFESLRDELMTAVVRGRLTEPTVEFESLRATRQLWDAIFGDSRSRRPRQKPSETNEE